MGERADELMQRGRTPDADEEFDESTAMAREDIEFTRAEMSSTIDAIQDRLDPERALGAGQRHRSRCDGLRHS